MVFEKKFMVLSKKFVVFKNKICGFWKKIHAIEEEYYGFDIEKFMVLTTYLWFLLANIYGFDIKNLWFLKGIFIHFEGYDE